MASKQLRCVTCSWFAAALARAADSVRALAYDIPEKNLSTLQEVYGTLYVTIVSRSYDKLEIIV